MVQPPRASGSTPERASPTNAQLLFRRALGEGMRREWVTEALVALNVGVFGWMVLAGVPMLSPDAPTLVAWGANFGPLTRGPEVWRLATSMFIHGGLLHLGFNMYALLMAGRLVERVYGHVGFALLYVLAGIAGSTASAFYSPLVPSVGASGGVFGVFGVLLAFLIRRRALLLPEVLRPLRRSVVLVVVLNVVFGFTVPGIDNAAHLGGLAAGFLGGLALAPRLDDEARLRRPILLFPIAALVIAGLVAWVALSPVRPSEGLPKRGVPGAAAEPSSSMIVPARPRGMLGTPEWPS